MNDLSFEDAYTQAMEEGWRLLKRGDEAYPPKAFWYRGGLYKYVLVESEDKE